MLKKLDHNLRHFLRIFDPIIEHLPLWFLLGLFAMAMFYLICRNEN